MDLYEALATGSSKEELLKAFHKELDEAAAKVEQEKAAKKAAEDKKAALDTPRKALVEAIVAYVSALCEAYDIDIEDDKMDSAVAISETAMKEFEDQVKSLAGLTKIFEKRVPKMVTAPKKSHVKKLETPDEAIIKAFLRSL